MSTSIRKRASRRRGISAERKCHKLGEGLSQGRHLMLECLEARRLLSVAPFISEVEASNKTGIEDAAGVTSDWLEICNPDPTTAVDLAGWSLTYQKTGSNNVTTWTIPSTSNVVLGPNESRVFFCDSNSATDPVEELHTNFNLSSGGATVELINPSSTVISTLTYPKLTSDTSYGVGETVSETDLVAAGATATYYAPTDNSLGTSWTQPGFNDTSWASGPTGLGYSSATVSGFATTLYKSNQLTVASVAQATAVTTTPSEQTSADSQTESVLNFLDSGGDGHFSNDNPFPGMTVGEGLNDYVLEATGTLTITASQAGYYTFGVNSDDGFTLTIGGASFSNGVNTTACSGGTMTCDKLQSATDTLATTKLAAGTYPITLIYFENQDKTGEMEFYAATESRAAGVTSFDPNSILVGATTATTASGGTSTTTTPLLVTSTSVGTSSPLSTAIETNVSSTVNAAIATTGSTSLYSRITFSASNLAALTSLTLRMQYDSGYVAYLNGVEIASSNAPASPTWNSAALEYRNSPVQDTTYQNVDISSFLNSATTGHLTATGNVLAIQTLMATPTDLDLFVSPAISEISITQAGLHTFAQPTPGTYNTPGSWQPDLTFSVPHGLYTSDFSLTLSTTTTGASIYYTTDSSTPTSQPIASITYSGTTATVTTQGAFDFINGETFQIANATPSVYDGTFAIVVPSNMTVSITGTNIKTFTYTLPSTPSSNASAMPGTVMTATHGILYTSPIEVSPATGIPATDVRAVSVVAGGQSGVVSTETYVFPAAVIDQPADPPGFPTIWGENDGGSPQSPNYAMNPQITQNPLYSAGLEQDLLSLPTVSITTDIPNMWSAMQSQSLNPGIYTNDDNLDQSNGVSMIVPASFEYFNSSGTISLQQNMGLQMEGGYGRNPPFQMHNFRMEFKSDYGPSSLNYPIIPGDPVTSFQNVDLKSGFNDAYSWAGSGSPPGDAAQYMRDIFASNLMLAMSQPSFASTYVLLYIDGLFWGLYEMLERPDADFAAAHLGGTASDWEANNAGHEVDGSATNLPYWNAFQNLPTSSPYATTSLAFYEQAQGNNAYFLNTYGTTTDYTDLLDPTNYIDYMLMNFYIGNTDWPIHNFYAAINTVDPTGFKFFSWDAEMSLAIIEGGYNSNVDVNVLGANTNVAIMYAALEKNPEFDMAFADQARQFLFDNGQLTPTPAIARYQDQINTIEQGMVLESARWGDIPTSPGPIPNTEAAWLNTANYITGTFLTQRTSILISQMQAAGLYPNIGAPEFYVNGTDEYGGTFN
ncbi:MAG: CotH kinase family protein, partial [Thermoguttaceae bacterium]